MTINVVGKKNYSLIGRMLCKTRPDIATEILQHLTPGEESDLSRIFFFHSRYREWLKPEINPVMARRIFITSMLVMYHPYVFKSSVYKVAYGFRKKLAACFDCDGAIVTRDIRGGVIAYKHYDDVQENVDSLVKFLRETN